VQYKLIARVELTDATLKRKKKAREIIDLIGERIFSVVADDKQKPLYH